MSDIDAELESTLQQHEAGVADLVAAYETAERTYFAAVTASAPVILRSVASNSSAWVPNVDMG